MRVFTPHPPRHPLNGSGKALAKALLSAKARAGALRRDSARLRSEARELLQPDNVISGAARSILAVLAAREKRYVEVKAAYVRELGGRRRLAVAVSALEEWGTKVVCRVRQATYKELQNDQAYAHPHEGWGVAHFDQHRDRSALGRTLSTCCVTVDGAKVLRIVSDKKIKR